MLEPLLTRPIEHSLVQSARGLSFLVLDELHTLRGRQGADVALLVRRVREACHAPHMLCVGTSATMASGGTHDEQRAEIASVASRLFGAEVKSESIIGETLTRETAELDFTDPHKKVPSSAENGAHHPASPVSQTIPNCTQRGSKSSRQIAKSFKETDVECVNLHQDAANFTADCERGDSNPHALRHWILSPNQTSANLKQNIELREQSLTTVRFGQEAMAEFEE